MSTVNVSITTKKQTVPAIPAPSGSFRYSLKNTANVVIQSAVSGVTASFPGVSDGTYTVTAQALSSENTLLGDPASSAAFTVSNTVEADVPDVVSVTIA
jgi:hypothetical protein